MNLKTWLIHMNYWHRLKIVVLAICHVYYCSCAGVRQHYAQLAEHDKDSKLERVVDKGQLIRLHYESASGELLEQKGYLDSTPWPGIFTFAPELAPASEGSSYRLEVSYDQIRRIDIIYASSSEKRMTVVAFVVIVAAGILIHSALESLGE
jgi:hypothetical protein